MKSISAASIAAILAAGCASGQAANTAEWELKAGIAGENSFRMAAFLVNATCLYDILPEGDVRKSIWPYGAKEPALVVHLHEDEPDDQAANAQFDRVCPALPTGAPS